MNSVVAMAVAAVSLLAADVTLAQFGSGNMMNGGNGGMWGSGGWMGGYGGIWGTLVIVIVVAGIVALIVKQKGK